MEMHQYEHTSCGSCWALCSKTYPLKEKTLWFVCIIIVRHVHSGNVVARLKSDGAHGHSDQIRISGLCILHLYVCVQPQIFIGTSH